MHDRIVLTDIHRLEVFLNKDSEDVEWEARKEVGILAYLKPDRAILAMYRQKNDRID